MNFLCLVPTGTDFLKPGHAPEPNGCIDLAVATSVMQAVYVSGYLWYTWTGC